MMRRGALKKRFSEEQIVHILQEAERKPDISNRHFQDL